MFLLGGVKNLSFKIILADEWYTRNELEEIIKERQQYEKVLKEIAKVVVTVKDDGEAIYEVADILDNNQELVY
jgi:hypothetical protein